MAGRKPNKKQDIELKQEEVVVEEPKKVVKKAERPKIERDDLVSCVNVTSGRLKYISKKTGLEVTWSNYGDEEFIEVAELLTMKSSQPKFLREPWLFIDDENVVEFLGLKEIYKNILPIQEVDELFNLSAKEVKEILPKLPKGMKELIAEKARQGIQNEELTNLKVIRTLEQELNLDLIALVD